MFDIKLAKKIAALSKISFTDIELFDIAADMDEILSVMDKVRDFQTDISISSARGADLIDLRADDRKKSSLSDEITANAAINKDGFFIVPRVV